MTFDFFALFEHFAAGCDHERYSDFMRRWEGVRGHLETCDSLGDVMRELSGALKPEELATIESRDGGHWLTIKGQDWRYVTRIAPKGGHRAGH